MFSVSDTRRLPVAAGSPRTKHSDPIPISTVGANGGVSSMPQTHLPGQPLRFRNDIPGRQGSQDHQKAAALSYHREQHRDWLSRYRETFGGQADTMDVYDGDRMQQSIGMRMLVAEAIRYQQDQQKQQSLTLEQDKHRQESSGLLGDMLPPCRLIVPMGPTLLQKEFAAKVLKDVDILINNKKGIDRFLDVRQQLSELRLFGSVIKP